MSIRKHIFILVSALLLASCQQDRRDHTSSTVSPFTGIQKAPEQNQPLSIAPPDPGAVIFFISGKEGDGSAAYEVANRSWAHYWYGHAYMMDGVQYFTGFVYQTPEKYGNSDEEEYSAPGTEATISQATFTAAKKGAEKPWEFFGAQPYVGEFGGYEKGYAISETESQKNYLTPAGNYVLAVPTWHLEGGISLKASEVLVMKHADKSWTYAGSIYTGEDNNSSCASDKDDEGLPPCVQSNGALEFKPMPGKDMPSIRVVMKGTTIDSPNETRQLGPQDTVEYGYDQKKAEYQIVKR